MKLQVLRAAWMGIAAIASATPAAAQQGPVEVAFELPLNLTRLPSVVTKVKVDCTLTSGAIIPRSTAPLAPHSRNAAMELPVTQGEVVQAIRLVITLDPQELDNPSGTLASYECKLLGFDPSVQRWGALFNGNTPGFIITPIPAPITGTFVW